MIYTPKIKDAIAFSIQTHEVDQKQKRKGKDIPYITHPLTVGLILARAGGDEDVVVAGILHDTIEDSIPEKKVTEEMLTERFGKRVAELVFSVTETNKGLSWETRKAEALEHIRQFSHESLLVKAADIISNVSEIVEDYKHEGDVIFTRFNAPKERMLESTYRLISAICRQWPESPLAEDLKNVMDKLTDIETPYVEGGGQDFFIGKDGERKLVRHLSETELTDYEELGRGGSPMHVTLSMAFKHNKNFFEQVAGYRVANQGIGKVVNKLIKKMSPNHLQAQPDMASTYIFYKKMEWEDVAAELVFLPTYRKESRTSTPFIAFVMDESDHSYEVHLVNPTDAEYTRVFALSGAFSGDIDGLLETSKVVKEMGALASHSSLLLERSDWDSLDFVIWFHLDLYSNQDSAPTMLSFDLPKYGGNYDDEIEQLPILEKKGVFIEAPVRNDGKSIEETIKTLDMSGKYTPSASSES